MATRHDDDVGVGRQLRPFEPRRNVFGDHFAGGGEPFTARELLAVVPPMHLEAALLRHGCEVIAHVSGANHVQLGRRLDRLDVDAHLSTADQSRLLGKVVVELVVHELRLAGGDGFARFPEGVVFVAAAADGATG